MSLELPARFHAEQSYSAGRFWRKVARVALIAGRKTIVTAITLFYCMRDKDTPAWAKGIIMGALGYLVLPVDLIPDAIPAVGFTDDWAALVSALAAVSFYVKDEHKQQAETRVEKFFGVKPA
jgi:uncharacterized membrane protein YkvA (DUF1232 family)